MAAKQKCVKFLKHHGLLLALVSAMAIGIAFGIAMRQANLTKRENFYLRFPGEVLMRLLKMIILPLLVSTLISGLTSLDKSASGKMGLRAVLYYFITTIIAVIIGIVLVVSIRPGEKSSDLESKGHSSRVKPADAFLDLLRNLFPKNLVAATFSSTQTKEIASAPSVIDALKLNETNMTHREMIEFVERMERVIKILDPGLLKEIDPDDEPVLRTKNSINVLGIVFFSIVFGVIIKNLGDEGKPLADFFNSLAAATMKLVSIVIWYAPIGIIFLIAYQIVKMDRPEEFAERLGFYALTVLLGLLIHGMFVLPGLLFLFTRRNPIKYIMGVSQALLTALGTASSSATLPITMRCLEENNGIDSRVTHFVLPIGATINMDGTALYEAVAAIFIAQYRLIPLDFADVITVSITATTASIGAAGVPEAGLITMVIVLTAVGLPVEDVTLILAIDWFLDRFRTMVNVLGDSVGAGIVQHLSRSELEKTKDQSSIQYEDLKDGAKSDGNSNVAENLALQPDSPGVDAENPGDGNEEKTTNF